MLNHILSDEAGREALKSILEAVKGRKARELKDSVTSLLSLLMNARGTCELIQLAEEMLKNIGISIPRNVSNISTGVTGVCLNPHHVLATALSIAYMIVAQRG